MHEVPCVLHDFYTIKLKSGRNRVNGKQNQMKEKQRDQAIF